MTTLERLLDLVRPEPVTDHELARRVAPKIPPGVSSTIEHGCIILRGPIATHERARLVRTLARVKGVDAVMDLMTEHAS